MDITKHNQCAWDHYVELGNRWTVPVTTEVICSAREGRWEVVLTPSKPVPPSWLGELGGADVLCLAGSGGQQGPVFAAAGATVTVFDNSPRQLAQDRLVADRDGLELTTVQGDMADLGCFADASFDVVFHPVSNCFVPDVRPVWREAYRVLRPGGTLLAGFASPVLYLVDDDLVAQTGKLEVVNRVPYSDVESLSKERRQRYVDQGEALEFGHTLEDQIGGQLECGFVLTALFEDSLPPDDNPLARHIQLFIATRAQKPDSRLMQAARSGHP